MKRKLFFILIWLIFIKNASGQSIYGIDVSHYQLTINWQQVYNAGKVFAYIKSSQGFTTDQNDTYFSANVTPAINSGLIIGAYHVAMPATYSYGNEATHFLSTAGSYIGNGYLPPALDIEQSLAQAYYNQGNSPAQLAQWINAWCLQIYNAKGIWPVVYVDRCRAADFYPSYNNGTINPNIRLWIADYSHAAGSPGNSSTCTWVGWPWRFHQYSETGSVSGISVAVDLDVFNGTMSDFNNLIGLNPCTPPSYDNCPGSGTNLTVGTSCGNGTSGTVICATASGMAKAACDNYTGTPHLKDVWYTFNAASTGTYTITATPASTSTATSNIDIVLAIYSGSCGSLTPVPNGCSDSGGGGGAAETVTVSLSAGIYRIRVYDYGNTEPTTGGFSICVYNSGPTCNTPSGTSETTTQTSATLSWNSVPSASNYTYRYRVNGTSTWTTLSSSNNSVVLNGLACGTTYEWEVRTNCSSGSSSYSSTRTFPTSGCGCSQPSNDGCTGLFTATLLNVGTSCNPVSSTSCGATSSGFSSCDGNQDDDVFFRFTPAASSATITVNSSTGYDAVFQILTGPCGGSMNPLACINNTGSGGIKTTTINGLTPGTQYFIRVWHSGTGSGTTGNFTICVYCTPPTSPTSATASQTTISIGQSTTLQVNGGALNDASNWIWYTGSCGGTQVGTGATLTVSPTTTTTYFVQASACNVSTTCRSVTITVNQICNPPTSPTSATASQTTISVGQSTTLQVNGGALNDASNWIWYTGSCGGTQVGTGATLNVSPTATTTYFVQASACNVSTTCRSVTITVNNPSCSSPTTQATSITFDLIGPNSLQFSFTIGDGQRRIIKMNTTNSFSTPVNGTDLVANNIYTGPGEQVIYNGTGNSVNVTGLSPNTNYCFRVYEYNCSGNSTIFLTSSGINNPRCMSTSDPCPSLTVPTNLSPGGLIFPGTVVTNNPTFSWNSTGAAFYQFELRKEPFAPSDFLAGSCTSSTLHTVSSSIFQNGINYRWSVSPVTSCISACPLNTSSFYYFTYNDVICTSPISPTSASASQTSITVGQSTTLQVNGGALNSATNWIWYTGGCGGTQVGTGATLSVSPTTTTTYFVQASACNVSTICRSVTITVNPICITPNTPGTPISNSPQCGTVIITRVGTPPAGETWYWQGTSCGTDFSLGSGSTYNATASGIYYIRAYSNAGNCWSANCSNVTVTVTPVVTPNIIISANPSGVICAGQSVTFTAISANGGNSPSYQWKINGVNVGTGSTYQSSGLTNGQVVSCELTSNLPCANPATVLSNAITMTVNPPVVPAISISLAPCSSNTVIFNSNIINGGSSPAYLWSFTGTGTPLTVITGSTFTLINVTSGTQVQCRLTSNANCATPTQVFSNTVLITIPSIVISGNLSFCQGSNTTLTATGANSYTWSNGSTTPSITVSSPGNYSVTGVSNGCADIKSASVTMFPLPNITLNPGERMYKGARIRLGSIPVATGNSPLTYKWTPATGLNSDTIANPIASPNMTTTYTLKVTDRNNCVSTKSIDVTVIGFYVFPNPTNDFVNILGSEITSGQYEISLKNMLGQVVYREQVMISGNNFTKQIPMSRLPAQIYLLSINGTGVSENLKILKNNY